VQVNLPGTLEEHPNSRQRLPRTIADALAHPRMREIAALLEENGRSDS
jgi:4-alpha-glucanotransferase